MEAKQPDDDLQAAHDLKPEDFYFDGPNMVFTSVYHLKRGYCCRSGCRHCPYSDAEAGQHPIAENAQS